MINIRAIVLSMIVITPIALAMRSHPREAELAARRDRLNAIPDEMREGLGMGMMHDAAAESGASIENLLTMPARLFPDDPNAVVVPGVHAPSRVDGIRPLMTAIVHWNVDSIRTLLVNGANPHDQDNDGYDAFYYAQLVRKLPDFQRLWAEHLRRKLHVCRELLQKR